MQILSLFVVSARCWACYGKFWNADFVAICRGCAQFGLFVAICGASAQFAFLSLFAVLPLRLAFLSLFTVLPLILVIPAMLLMCDFALGWAA